MRSLEKNATFTPKIPHAFFAVRPYQVGQRQGFVHAASLSASFLVTQQHFKRQQQSIFVKSRFCNNCDIPHGKGATQCRVCDKKLYNMGDDRDVKDWIAKYSERKVEANALMKVQEKGRGLYRGANREMSRYDAVSSFESKRHEVKDEFEAFRQQNRLLFLEIEGLTRERFDKI